MHKCYVTSSWNKTKEMWAEDSKGWENFPFFLLSDILSVLFALRSPHPARQGCHSSRGSACIIVISRFVRLSLKILMARHSSCSLNLFSVNFECVLCWMNNDFEIFSWTLYVIFNLIVSYFNYWNYYSIYGTKCHTATFGQ